MNPVVSGSCDNHFLVRQSKCTKIDKIVHYDVTNARKLAEARHRLDWDGQFRLSLYGEHARKIHERERSAYFTVSFPATASTTSAIVTGRVFENGIDQPNRRQSMIAFP